MRIRTAHDLAAATRGRRLDLGWSQADAARRAGASRKWVSDFENGKATVDLAVVLRLLDALGIGLDAVATAPTADTPAPPVGTGPTRRIDLDALLEDYLAR